jgi:hypothetical protein
MARHHLLFALAGGVGIALACGSGGSSDVYSRRKSSSGGVSVGDPTAYGAMDQAYRVPPDRAVVRVDAVVTADTAALATKELRARIATIEAAAGEERCQAQLLDYGPPVPYGDGWRGNAEVRVDMLLAALDGVPARMDALDACLARLRPVVTSDDGVDLPGKDGRVWVQHSHASELLVDDPGQHAEALLARRARSLSVLANDGAAPQLAPEDLRCTATGGVGYGERRLAGVELILGMNCRVIDPTVEIELGDEASPPS